MDKNLNKAWNDCQGTCESVPHSWVEKSIEIVGINNKMINYRCIIGEIENNASF
jgi:hypothetical protein